jgi:hypothetical protein
MLRWPAGHYLREDSISSWAMPISSHLWPMGGVTATNLAVTFRMCEGLRGSECGGYCVGHDVGEQEEVESG